MKLISRILVMVALLGLLLFSLPYAYYWQLAVKIDKSETEYSFLAGNPPPCSYPFGYDEDLAITVSRRVITEVESIVFEAFLSNRDSGEQNCEVTLSISSAGFEVVKESDKKVTIPPGKHTTKASWILKPNSLGTHPILLEGGNQSETKGVTINNLYGIHPQVWAILTGIFFLISSGAILRFLSECLRIIGIFPRRKKGRPKRTF